ncbi:hypothetical protein, partial [Sphingobacterium daejeonense]|uniref:hypothetical protein n=1 Tax=Sphingobacterium daejeonense TaxID=371142 RepID=UPI003D316E66
IDFMNWMLNRGMPKTVSGTCLLYTSPAHETVVLYLFRRQSQMCIIDSNIFSELAAEYDKP